MNPDNNNGGFKCSIVVKTVSVIVGTIILSSVFHWLLSVIYFYSCIGITFEDLILSPIRTGSLGCQLVFRGMKYTHNQYLRQFLNILTAIRVS